LRRITVRQRRLLDIGHEAQGELLRDEAFHQPLRIWKVSLAAAPGHLR
jgi:hypothetical protein